MDILHIFSDGPTTQYRQKGNFYLFATNIFQRGFSLGSWNFHEAGHGKGAPDGIGAALKRTADSLVSMGTDICSAAAFHREIKATNSSIKLYLVEVADVQTGVKSLANIKLVAVAGTMKIHQVITDAPCQIYHREISCFCERPQICKCHQLQIAKRLIAQSDIDIGNLSGRSLKGRPCVERKHVQSPLYMMIMCHMKDKT